MGYLYISIRVLFQLWKMNNSIPMKFSYILDWIGYKLWNQYCVGDGMITIPRPHFMRNLLFPYRMISPSPPPPRNCNFLLQYLSAFFNKSARNTEYGQCSDASNLGSNPITGSIERLCRFYLLILFVIFIRIISHRIKYKIIRN